MDVPVFFRALWAYKWLLLVGLVIAALVAVVAGYKVETGRFELRAEVQYAAATTVLINNPNVSAFQAEIPGQTVDPTTAPAQAQDLANAAVIYAYLISGTQIRNFVEEKIGQLSETETITATQRTTQPTGSEAFPGRYELPILDIVGAAGSKERAELIASTATEVFLTYAQQEQDARAIPAEDRVQLTALTTPKELEIETSNPYVPMVVVGLGVFLAFIALALLLYNIRIKSRPRRDPGSDRFDDDAPEDPTDLSGDWTASLRETATR